MKRLLIAAVLSSGLLLHASVGLCVDADQYRTALEEANRTLDTCLNGADTTVAMRTCQGAASQALDTLLNQTYKTLRDSIKEDKAFAEALKKEQLAWIKLRDEATRNAMDSACGGTIGPLSANSIALGMMRNRIALFISLMPE